MAHQRLQNYLRTHRRRHGFSQSEVAMLLGAASGTKVSRYENLARMPAVNTAFAYEVVFGQPASELFAGRYHAIRLAVQERAKRLAEQLTIGPNAQSRKTFQKLARLRAIVEPKPSSARRG